MDRIAMGMLILGNLIGLGGEFITWRIKRAGSRGYYVCKVLAGVLIVIAALLYFVY